MNLEQARTALASAHPDQCVPALKTLSESGALTDLQAVLALLKQADPVIQKAAIETAGALIKRNLIEHFNELNTEVRKKLSALMESLHPRIIEEISRDIYCDDDLRRLRAIQILGLLRKNPKVRDILADLVKDRNEKIRATAVNLIGKLIGPDEQHIILSLLNDKDTRVRANTVEALERLGNKRLVPILLRFRKDPNNRIRANVLKALYNLGQKDIVSDLLLMIQDEDDFMKASGLWVISQLGVNAPHMEDRVGLCLVSDNDMVRRNAEKALKSINSPRSLGYLRYLGSRK